MSRACGFKWLLPYMGADVEQWATCTLEPGHAGPVHVGQHPHETHPVGAPAEPAVIHDTERRHG
jgi:hypothetical protein